MLVLGFDVEATGLDVKKDSIIEIGAILFDVKNSIWNKVEEFSQIVYESSYGTLSKEVIEVTGITNEMLRALGKPFVDTIDGLLPLLEKSSVIVAHNKQFDKSMLLNQLERYRLPNCLSLLDGKDWICSIEDLKSNRKMKCMKLSHLALDYGVTVNPKELHRASNDVELMGKLLTEAKADPIEMLGYSKEPNIIIRAHIMAPWKDGGEGKKEAQRLGFSWEKTKNSDRVFDKMWVKRIKESEKDAESKEASFPISVIGRL